MNEGQCKKRVSPIPHSQLVTQHPRSTIQMAHKTDPDSSIIRGKYEISIIGPSPLIV